MADKSKIEWTDATWNPIKARNIETGGIGHFCEKVSPGCANCYAERMQPRFKNAIRYNAADGKLVELFLDETVLTQPLRWQRPRMIFPCSMTDLFGSWVPNEWLDQIFAVMALTPQHTFQLLTKRAERMAGYCQDVVVNPFAHDGYKTRPRISKINHQIDVHLANNGGLERRLRFIQSALPLQNVWLGVSVEDQKHADERIPLLLETPAAVRWLSMEPLLGPVDLERELGAYVSGNPSPLRSSWLRKLDWIVAGGESGPKARPMHPDWLRSIRDQTRAANVPFHFKQWGEWLPLEEADEIFCKEDVEKMKSGDLFRDGTFFTGNDIAASIDVECMIRVGKQNAGRTLDGRTWDEMPEVSR